MTKHLITLTEPSGRPTFGIVEDPYATLAQRVVDGLLSAKQAAATPMYVVEDVPLDRARLDKAIAWERLIERAKYDPQHVIELHDKKKLTPADLDALRAALNARSMTKEENWSAPWPWREEQ